METIEEIKKIKSCSRCGLCAQVCPIFETEKNEVSLCRGKFLQLTGILRGDLKYNKRIEKNLEFCLNCEKCTQNCPSDINTVELFSKIKQQKMGAKKQFLRRILNSEFIFNLKLLPLRLMPKKNFPALEKGEIYFRGCLSKYKKNDNTDTRHEPFKCCGLPFVVSGRRDIYEKMVEHNRKIIEDPSVKKVLFDCATCFNEVKKYPFSDPKSVQKLEFMPLCSKNSPHIQSGKTFTFYRPCHLPMEEFEKIEKEFLEMPNYVKLENTLDAHSCCGFGGDFFLRHPIVAHKLSVKLAKKIHETDAQIVFAPCPTCSWSLKWGLWFLTFLKFAPKRCIVLLWRV